MKQCVKCGGPTLESNQTGVCSRNPECKRIWRRLNDQKYRTHTPRQSTPAPQRHGHPSWHPWEIPDDGIIDNVAVELAVRGVRHVRLTPPEQAKATMFMVHSGYGWKEICDHLGVGSARLTDILRALGYEAVRDPTQSGAKYSARKLITRIDRPRGRKLLG